MMNVERRVCVCARFYLCSSLCAWVCMLSTNLNRRTIWPCPFYVIHRHACPCLWHSPAQTPPPLSQLLGMISVKRWRLNVTLKFLLFVDSLLSASCQIPHSLISVGFEPHRRNNAHKLERLLFFYFYIHTTTEADVKIETVIDALII